MFFIILFFHSISHFKVNSNFISNFISFIFIIFALFFQVLFICILFRFTQTVYTHFCFPSYFYFFALFPFNFFHFSVLVVSNMVLDFGFWILDFGFFFRLKREVALGEWQKFDALFPPANVGYGFWVSLKCLFLYAFLPAFLLSVFNYLIICVGASILYSTDWSALLLPLFYLFIFLMPL